VVAHRDAAAAGNFGGATTAAASSAHHRAAMRGERGLARAGRTRISPPRSRRRNASRATGSISRLDQKNYATPKPIVAKITRQIK
jgi:hypothetical protein